MTKHFLKLALVFLSLTPYFLAEEGAYLSQKHTLTSSKVPDALYEPKSTLPTWTSRITDSWDNEIPKEISFLDDAQWIVKKILYYPSGMLFQEIDLAEPSQNGASQGMQHGALWTYYEDGEILRTEQWVLGKKEGIERSFTQEGERIEEKIYENGILEGVLTKYNASGSVLERITYHKGLRNGPYELYWTDGSKRCEANYSQGLLQGRSIEWWENGVVKSVCFWLNGLLHSIHTKPGMSLYSREGKLLVQQDFVGGCLNGHFRKWHSNGFAEMEVTYVLGKKDGPQEYYDQRGIHIGHREYSLGTPVGHHWKKNSQGIELMSADFSSDGTGSVCTFDAQGQKKNVYGIKQGLIEGEFLEWDITGNLNKKLHYEQNILHGTQEGFFSQEAPHFSFLYDHGLRHGLQQQWFQNGQLAARETYVHGMKHGLCELWHVNGTKKFQATYKEGLLDGALFWWYESGEKSETQSWKLGKQIAKSYAWNTDGVQIKHEEWRDGIPHGLWQEWYDSGKKMSECTYDNGQLHGRDISWYENGKVEHLALWKNGKQEGLTEEWFEDGSICSKGSFSQGKPEGIHETMYEPSQTHVFKSVCMTQERFVQGKLHGKQTAYYPNGQIKMEAVYTNGILDGDKKIFDEQGTCIFSATYIQGKLHGPVCHIRPDGCKEIQQYLQNHPEGTWQVYYPDHPSFGSIKALEAFFSSGVLHGKYTEYNQTGQQIYSVQYEHGNKEGKACFYSPDGRLEISMEYHQGQLQGPSYTFYPSGALLKQAIYVNNLLEGEEKRFFESGEVSQIATYSRGKLQGPIRAWDIKGHLIFEGEYVQGLRSGIFKKYDQKGRLRVFQKFENDVLIDRQEFSKTTGQLSGINTIVN